MNFQSTRPLLMDVKVHEATNSLVMTAPDPFQVRELIPKSKLIDHPVYNVACQWTAESATLLRNLGFNAPAPRWHGHKWPGKYTPMDHQLRMIEFRLKNKRGFDLSEMGTMKTSPCLWAADLLMAKGKVQRAAIICPLSTMKSVWMQEIFDTCMHRVGVVVHGTREQREEAMAQDVSFYVINHDAMRQEWLVTQLRKRNDINLIIVDEGDFFRNARIDMYKGLQRVLERGQPCWWLTGTPCPNAPTDAWAQAKLINPGGVPQYFGQFKRWTMVQFSNFKWKPKKGAEQLAYQALQPAIRFKKSDVLDLPPKVTISLAAGLSKEQKVAFSNMKALMAADIGKDTISAVNAADKITKLRQILCGVVKDPQTGEYLPLDFAPRMAVLKQAISQAHAKVIVVVPFTGVLWRIAEELAKTHTVGVLNGQVSQGKRDRIIADFKGGPDPHILAVHPRVTSHGLNLTEADYLVFYAPIYSNAQFSQVIERFDRAGQTRKMTICRLGGHSLEWDIYKLVDARAFTQANILKLYRRIIT